MVWSLVLCLIRLYNVRSGELNILIFQIYLFIHIYLYMMKSLFMKFTYIYICIFNK